MSRGRTSALCVTMGGRVRIDPTAATGGKDCFGLPRSVKGTVVYINRAHRWFLVEWGSGLRSGFRFDDLGGEVLL